MTLKIKIPDLNLHVTAEQEPPTRNERIGAAVRRFGWLVFLLMGVYLFWVGLDGLPPALTAILRVLIGASMIIRGTGKVWPTRK